MPSASKNPQTGAPLPKTELNPLLNPLLGTHMGRWAEVYFTNPPEKREEAVLELVRELEREAEQKSEPDEVGKDVSASEAVPVEPAPYVEEEEVVPIPPDEPTVACPSCGQENPPNQRFCGMCGAPMSEGNDPGTVEEPGPEASSNEFREPYEGFVGFSAAERNPFERAWEPGEGPNLIPEYDRGSYRYRIYVGVALALIVGALIYMAWRGTQASLGRTHTLPAAAPTEDTSSRPPQPAETSPAPAEKNQTAKEGSSNATSATTAKAGRKIGERNSPRAVPTENPQEEETAAKNPAAKDDGTQELQVAQGYLSGTQGKARDNAEAAKWLWRSVAKHNSAATVALADLYLHGSGVGKNCDQARILLDTAARKGVAGAGERLRNLQAFGCQ